MGEVTAIDEPRRLGSAIGADPLRPVQPSQRRQSAQRGRRRRRRRRRPARASARSCRDVNLEIIEPGPEPNAITMRVHERGAGITEACGTGACASAWAAAAWGLVPAGSPKKSWCTWTAEMPRYVCTNRRPAGSRSSVRREFVAHHHRRRSPEDEHRCAKEQRRHMSTPYNEALGATLIERTKRERIVLVGVTLPGHTDEDTEASLDELALLIDTAGADEAGRLVAAPRRARPHLVHRQGQGRGAARHLPGRRRRHGGVRQRAQPGAAVQPGEAARPHRARSHRGDPRHLRPERAHAGGQGAGRAGTAALPPAAAAPRRRRQAVAAARRRRQPVR